MRLKALELIVYNMFMAKAKKDLLNYHSLTGLIQRMFGVLAVQYAIGMFIAMFSGDEDPSKKPLYAHLAFFAHVFFAVLLLVGSIMIYINSRKTDNEHFTRLALYGLVSIIAACVGGVMTVVLKETLSEVGSFIMALGFLAGFVSYGYLFFISRNTSRLAL